MDEPLLDKMQALMGKYHTANAAGATHSIEADPLTLPDYETTLTFPILTDIVKLGDAVFHDPQLIPDPFSTPDEITVDTADQIARRVLHEVDTQLSSQVTALIAPRLQQALDETLAALLPQLTINIQHIIHDTLVKEFANHGIPLNPTDDSV